MASSTSLQLRIASATLRVVLRAYFTVLPFILSFAGKKCCEKRVKLRILEGRPFNLALMTGWLDSFTVVTAAFSLRAIPSGWLGYIMVLSSLLWVACDLVITGLVVPVSVVSRCPFNTTGYYAVIQGSAHSGIPGIETAPFGQSYRTISQARITSLDNGGLGGIYKKVNSASNFRADSTDVWGQWTCEDVNQDRSCPGYVNDTELTAIVADLQSQNLLYDEYSTSCSEVYSDKSHGLLLLWTASEATNSTKPWDFRAAVDISGDHTLPQTLKTFSCHLDPPSLQGILAQTDVDWNVVSWCNELSGYIYGNQSGTATVSPNPGAAIESILDAIVMSAGVSWLPSEGKITDPTQGCLATRTKVPWPAILVFLLATALICAMVVYWTFLTIALHHVVTGTELSKERISAIEKQMPKDLLGWMMQAVCETGSYQVHQDDLVQLKNWSFGYQPSWDYPGLSKIGGDAEVVPVGVHFPEKGSH